MKTAEIINQINAGVHLILENTKTNIIMDTFVAYQGKDIPWEVLKEVLDKRFEEASNSVDE